ncbi:UNVERIFIED_CONTAM: hypothetical protein HDU68_000789 [Siphonaria sp. JEL0065]|nr:hypothetical protein HDU68_000789 [Siphonaria sp. JEL0065]
MMHQTLVFALLVSRVLAHAVLIDPVPRVGMAVDLGIKYVGNITNYVPDPSFPSCAEFQTPGPVTKRYVAGQNVTILWNNTLPHPSPPGVTLSVQYMPGQDFLKLAEGVDDTPQTVTVALPSSLSSPNAVLRFMWQSMSDGGFYVGCADVAIAPATELAAPSSRLAVPVPTYVAPVVVAPDAVARPVLVGSTVAIASAATNLSKIPLATATVNVATRTTVGTTSIASTNTLPFFQGAPPNQYFPKGKVVPKTR